MIRIAVTPRAGENLYGLLVAKEVELRRRGKGTLHRSGRKEKDRDKWVHATYKGWIRFQRGLGGMVVALVQSKSPDEEWMLLRSFIGFLDRSFRASIANINVAYGAEADTERR